MFCNQCEFLKVKILFHFHIVTVSHLSIDRNGYLSVSRKYIYTTEEKVRKGQQMTWMNQGWRDKIRTEETKWRMKEIFVPTLFNFDIGVIWLLGSRMHIQTALYLKWVRACNGTKRIVFLVVFKMNGRKKGIRQFFCVVWPQGRGRGWGEVQSLKFT